MLRQSKKLLKKLIKLTNNTEYPFIVQQNSKISMVSDASRELDYAKYHGQLIALLNDLKANEYISQSPSGSISLTLKAMYRREYAFKAFMNAVMNKFVYGFITGVASTIIAALLIEVLQ